MAQTAARFDAAFLMTSKVMTGPSGAGVSDPDGPGSYWSSPAVRASTSTADPEPPLLPWLSRLVRVVLRLPDDEPVRDRTLVGLGMESLQAIALQYQLMDQVGADVSIEDLMGGRDVARLAELIAAGLDPEALEARARELPA